MTLFRDWEVTVPEGWAVRLDDELAALEHADGLATLRVQSLRTAASGLEPRQWVTFTARINERRGRPLAPIRFGPFAGHRSQFAIEGDVIISWNVATEAMGVDATYRAPGASARLESEANAIVSSLRPRDRASGDADAERGPAGA